MTKKTLILLASIVLGLVLIFLIVYYFGNSNNSNGGVVSTIKTFFPFGGNDEPQTQEPNTNTPNTEEEPAQPLNENFAQKLRKISDEPVSGAGLLDLKSGTIVRHIEKATGHIYETELFSSRKERISNTTIPVVYDAIWGNNNQALVARYLKDDNLTVDTYTINLKGISTSTENILTGISMAKNILDVSILNDSIFYLTQGVNSSAGYISTFDGRKIKQIWNSDIKEVRSQYVNSKIVALTTNQAPNIPGYLYFVDTVTGLTRRILGDKVGLSTIVDPTGNVVFYLEQGVSAKTHIYNIKNGSQNEITPSTFPEKCVWSKKDTNILYCAVPQKILDSNSLSLWYMGLTENTDDIWKYDVKNNTASIVENLEQSAGYSIDVIKPILSENEQYLVFINKKDNSLWSLDLLQ